MTISITNEELGLILDALDYAQDNCDYGEETTTAMGELCERLRVRWSRP